MAGEVLLFGKLKDAFGASAIDLPENVGTAADLRARLMQIYPELAAMLSRPAMRIAVNKELVANEAALALSPGDEIALLPPLSGG